MKKDYFIVRIIFAAIFVGFGIFHYAHKDIVFGVILMAIGLIIIASLFAKSK
jgi:NADH:ubiquinone oxidoreductase subunit 6 (subunit J)